MTMEAVSQLVTRLGASTYALVVLGAVLEEKTGGARLDPSIKAESERFLGMLGVPEMLSGVEGAQLGPVIAEIRSILLQGTSIFLNPASEPGWKVVDAKTLQAQGDYSARHAYSWRKNIVPHLEGLSARLASNDGAFLDVGVGVAALAIAMAQLWPSLRVVGIDPWAPVLEIARKNVARAELSTRIELREQAVQDLADTEVFDFAWLPSGFLGGAIVRAALERIYQGLRSGGWVLMSAASQNPDPNVAAYLRLVQVLHGGSAITPAEAEALLSDIGYAQVQTLSGAATSRASRVVGRKG